MVDNTLTMEENPIVEHMGLRAKGKPLGLRRWMASWRSRLGWSFLALVVATVVLLWSPTVIIPPSQPEEPRLVYVVDHGMHSRLVLPDEAGGLVQYTYGDWQYFALQQQTVVTALQALFWPTPATLGRRDLSSISQVQAPGTNREQQVLELVVSGPQMVQLRSRLDTWFTDHQDNQVHHPASNLHFVKVEPSYTVFHNSNHELVSWLHDLDCEVRGFVLWPNFKVKT